MAWRNWQLLARRGSAWLLAALLLATLAPGLSRALSTSKVGSPDAPAGLHWVELCTSQGTAWVQIDPGGRSAEGAEPDALDLCGHCTLATERFAPLIPVLLACPAVADPSVQPFAEPWASAPAPPRSAQARGPPLQA